MTLNVMLTLDYSGKEEHRDAFYAALAAKRWEKISRVDTLWVKAYAYTSEHSSYHVNNDLRETMLESAREFKVASIYYVAQIGNAGPIERGVYKTSNGYEYSEY